MTTWHSAYDFTNPKTAQNIDLMCRFCKSENTRPVDDKDLTTDFTLWQKFLKLIGFTIYGSEAKKIMPLPACFRKCYVCGAVWPDRKHPEYSKL